MAKLVAEHGHQEDACYHIYGLCAQSIDIILGSRVNIFERACVIV